MYGGVFKFILLKPGVKTYFMLYFILSEHFYKKKKQYYSHFKITPENFYDPELEFLQVNIG